MHASINDNEETDDILKILKKTFPSIYAYEILGTVDQANAYGVKLVVTEQRLQSDHNDARNLDAGVCHSSSLTRKCLYLKRVNAERYCHKPWGDLRRTLTYIRTEVRFYKEFLPILRESHAAKFGRWSNWTIAPNCLLADYDLSNLIPEEECAMTLETRKNEPTSRKVPHYDEDDVGDLFQKSGFILLDAVLDQKDFEHDHARLNVPKKELSDDIYYVQKSPLQPISAKLTLEALAIFHSTSFEKEKLLEKASRRLCIHGGSYHLSIRNPLELENIESSWSSFLSAFSHLHDKVSQEDTDTTNLTKEENEGKNASIRETLIPHGFFNTPSIQNLGTRMKKIAVYVSKQLSPTYKDKYATIVHGDYKAMNIFLPSNHCSPTTVNKENNQKNCIIFPPLLIDFASVGVGFGMIDVAMHIVHAVLPEDQENHGELSLVKYYLACLHECLEKVNSKNFNALSDSGKKVISVENFKSPYTIDESMRHYKLACIDYLRFIMGRFWKTASVESFHKLKSSMNFSLLNRDIVAAVVFIKKVDGYMTDVEKEMQQD
mmetsp:Transcript_1269/g.1815  ORF Transcript_1269/g.1815 Transcript_1269/m.1815 type:complete len:547 (+) Transcript_1269:53-1693(+)